MEWKHECVVGRIVDGLSGNCKFCKAKKIYETAIKVNPCEHPFKNIVGVGSYQSPGFWCSKCGGLAIGEDGQQSIKDYEWRLPDGK